MMQLRTAIDLARRLRVSRARAYVLVRRLAPVAQMSGRRWRLYRAEDVDALVEQVQRRRERKTPGRTGEVPNS